MQASVTSSMDLGLATIRLNRKHGNAIDPELTRELTAAYESAEADPAVRGVLLAAEGKLFCPGLDVLELIELDREAMEQFLVEFNRMVLTLYAFPKPVVAALHGHAIAGGCVLALTADRRVLREGAMIGLNEVRVGLPLPFAVAWLVRESVPRMHLEEIVLVGRNYSDDAAVTAGLAHEIYDGREFESYCVGKLEEMTSKEPRATSVTKRYLRSGAVERMRERAASLDHEFLDTWFSPPTQKRLCGVAEQLRGRQES